MWVWSILCGDRMAGVKDAPLRIRTVADTPLKHVVEYMNHHAGNVGRCSEGTKTHWSKGCCQRAAAKANARDEAPPCQCIPTQREWDVQFIDNKSPREIIDLLAAAEFLHIPTLIDLALAKILTMRDQLSTEQREHLKSKYFGFR